MQLVAAGLDLCFDARMDIQLLCELQLLDLHAHDQTQCIIMGVNLRQSVVSHAWLAPINQTQNRRRFKKQHAKQNLSFL